MKAKADKAAIAKIFFVWLVIICALQRTGRVDCNLSVMARFAAA